MGTKIVTEADRKRTPAPAAPKGVTLSTKCRGQRVSQERGAHTRNKKNPGKRALMSWGASLVFLCLLGDATGPSFLRLSARCSRRRYSAAR